MLAISFARRHKKAAEETLSDAVAIALFLGVSLGLGLYFLAPLVLQKIAGDSSAAVVGPALKYINIRYLFFQCGTGGSCGLDSSFGSVPIVVKDLDRGRI